MRGYRIHKSFAGLYLVREAAGRKAIHTTLLQGFFLILEILNHERQPPVAKKVGFSDEKQFDLKFHWLAELQLVDRARAYEIPPCADVHRLVDLARVVIAAGMSLSESMRNPLSSR